MTGIDEVDLSFVVKLKEGNCGAVFQPPGMQPRAPDSCSRFRMALGAPVVPQLEYNHQGRKASVEVNYFSG